MQIIGKRCRGGSFPTRNSMRGRFPDRKTVLAAPGEVSDTVNLMRNEKRRLCAAVGKKGVLGKKQVRKYAYDSLKQKIGFQAGLKNTAQESGRGVRLWQSEPITDTFVFPAALRVMVVSLALPHTFQKCGRGEKNYACARPDSYCLSFRYSVVFPMPSRRAAASLSPDVS